MTEEHHGVTVTQPNLTECTQDASPSLISAKQLVKVPFRRLAIKSVEKVLHLLETGAIRGVTPTRQESTRDTDTMDPSVEETSEAEDR